MECKKTKDYDLKPENIKLLMTNLHNLKENLEIILKRKKEDNKLSGILKQITDFFSWIKTFTDKNQKATNADYVIREKNIKEITEKLENYFKEDDELNKFLEMSKLINDSKEILRLLVFEPPKINYITSNKANITMNINNSLFSGFDIEHEEDLEQLYDDISDNPIEKSNNNIRINNNNNSLRSLTEEKNKFKNNFSDAIKILISKFQFIYDSDNIEKYPILNSLDDNNYFKSLLDFFEWIFTLSSDKKSIKISEETEIENKELKNFLEDILCNQNTNGDISYENNESSDELYIFEKCDNKNFNFDIIKQKLFYFINIIPKGNNKLTNDDLTNISSHISKTIDINKCDLLLIQNSPIENYVKSINFQDFHPKEISPIISKFNELKTLKKELLIKDYNIDIKYFDNRGNFLNQIPRNNLFRGKEKYDPPQNDWMGLGLNVLGKYDEGNDDWLEDISNKSEWAIAYRGITSKNNSKYTIKDYLKYFIVKGNLKIAETNNGEKINDKRHWRTVGKGIWMTPSINIAEKYTQTILFNEKTYKVLLMAKVKIDKIREPIGTNFWVLNNDDIRIYRILFKEIQ